MRSDDSRTRRWTVYITNKEFQMLEILRQTWRGRGVRSSWQGQSRAELLVSLVQALLADDALAVSMPTVVGAYEQVEQELWRAGDHVERGGGAPRISPPPR